MSQFHVLQHEDNILWRFKSWFLRRRLGVQAKKNAGRPWTPYHNSSKVREGGREKGEEEEKQLPASSGVDPTDSSHLESVRKGGRRERKGRLPCWLWRLAPIQQVAAHLENLREGEGRGRGGGSFLLAPVREGEGGRGRGRGGRGEERKAAAAAGSDSRLRVFGRGELGQAWWGCGVVLGLLVGWAKLSPFSYSFSFSPFSFLLFFLFLPTSCCYKASPCSPRRPPRRRLAMPTGSLAVPRLNALRTMVWGAEVWAPTACNFLRNYNANSIFFVQSCPLLSKFWGFKGIALHQISFH